MARKTNYENMTPEARITARVELKAKIEALKFDLQRLDAIIMAEYPEGGKHIGNADAMIQVFLPTVQRRFNTDRFKRDYPDLYDDYRDDSPRGGYIK